MIGRSFQSYNFCEVAGWLGWRPLSRASPHAVFNNIVVSSSREVRTKNARFWARLVEGVIRAFLRPAGLQL